MMATNMPEALDEALLRPGRIDRIYKVGYPSQGRPDPHLRGLLRQGPARAHRGADRQAGHDHPVRDRRHDQGPGQRVADQRDPGRPRRHHLAGRGQGQAAQGARAARGRRVHRAGAARGRRARGLPRGRRVPDPAAHGDRHRHHREGQRLPRHGRQHPAGGPVHPVAVASTSPTSSSRSPRWPASGCSSTATRSSGRVRRPGVGDPGGLVHGGLLGDGLDRLVVLDRAAAAGRQPRRAGPAGGREARGDAAPGAGRPDRGQARRAAGPGRGDPRPRTGPRCSRWRTRWRRTDAHRRRRRGRDRGPGGRHRGRLGVPGRRSSRRGWRTTTPPPSAPTAGTAGCRWRCRRDAPQWTVRRRKARAAVGYRGPGAGGRRGRPTLVGWTRSRSGGGRTTRSAGITGSSSTKPYRCPGCDQLIRPATPHVVAWPLADAEAATAGTGTPPAGGPATGADARSRRSRSARVLTPRVAAVGRVGHVFDLTGKTALITGASRGIGAAIAAAFVAAGARVALNSRGAEQLEKTAADVGGAARAARRRHRRGDRQGRRGRRDRRARPARRGGQQRRRQRRDGAVPAAALRRLDQGDAAQRRLGRARAAGRRRRTCWSGGPAR